jgi:trehalose 6-phosphate phosphatase
MTDAATAKLESVLAPIRSAPGSAAILCDVDGTLAPIVDDPGAAAVPEPTREVLRALAGAYALVGCLTGRRALDARRIVGVEELTYAGNHGFESLAPGEDEPTPDPAVAGRVDRARAFLDRLDPERLGSVGLSREDKGAIQALHWRRAPAEAAARMRAQEVATLARGSDLVPRWGRKVLEIRPVAGIDKGSAALRLVRASGVSRALFGGDDETDLDAFQALRWMEASGRLESAVCVGVTSDEQPADLAERSQLLVDGTEGFRAVLESLVV